MITCILKCIVFSSELFSKASEKISCFRSFFSQRHHKGCILKHIVLSSELFWKASEKISCIFIVFFSQRHHKGSMIYTKYGISCFIDNDNNSNILTIINNSCNRHIITKKKLYSIISLNASQEKKRINIHNM